VLRRLLGLETEYAIGIEPCEGSSLRSRPTNADAYAAMRQAIEWTVRARPGDRSQQQIFVENGGSFSYESLPWARAEGLLEGATAECRSPSTALLYQRAQDALLVRALPRAEQLLASEGPSVRLSLRKNCRDAEGHVYGAQESYEAELATGPALWAWRAGLVLLVPLALVSTLVTWAVALVSLVVLLVLALLLALLGAASGRVRASALWAEAFGERDAPWFERTLARPLSWLERALWEPVMRPFFALLAALGFRRIRREAMAFLVTRPVLTGAGTLHRDESFGLSEKGPSITGLARTSVAPRDRCLWDGGNLCKGVVGLALLRFRRFAALFARRQRLQLGLSDSNVTQVAELLKVGTTALVLDMVERGALRDLPPLRRPLGALRAVIADPELRARIRWGDEELTALQVQRRYLERAQRFVQQSAVASLEAAEIVALWARTLDGLERDPASQVGRVDWVTKRFLLDTAGDGEPWEVRKAIDLRLHELGPHGTLAMLEAQGLAPRLVSVPEVEAAIYEPPTDSPAQRRSRLIRTLHDQPVDVKVYWDRVRIGGPLRGKVIRLDDHRRER
jgi:Pup amidohydrolase